MPLGRPVDPLVYDTNRGWSLGTGTAATQLALERRALPFFFWTPFVASSVVAGSAVWRAFASANASASDIAAQRSKQHDARRCSKSRSASRRPIGGIISFRPSSPAAETARLAFPAQSIATPACVVLSAAPNTTSIGRRSSMRLTRTSSAASTAVAL